MKKGWLLTVLLVGTFSVVQAQRYAVIDSHYILEHMPEYQTAQKKLDVISKQWQQEVQAKLQQANQLYMQYNAEKVMLTDTLRKKRQDEIMNLEKQARELQQQRFGYEGDLFKEREELIKPIQDKIYAAVQKLAAQNMYDFVLDKSGGITVFYADPKLDKSDDVLKILGLKN
ncbi:MAG: OmpH family outer membrane protein [Chitinophagaceae bacterium]|jgi:outer membrane protein|nr:MAG: OmpH family outer membrane protein [Chitinophagaceae bacterium]